MGFLSRKLLEAEMHVITVLVMQMAPMLKVALGVAEQNNFCTLVANDTAFHSF